MSPESVSFETVRTHHGIWRWKLEREASNKLVKSWQAVHDSDLHSEAKTALMNVAWSLAAFERSFHMMSSDAHRAEQARRDGVPAIMGLLTGPHERSLEYLLTMSLWMDLGEFLSAYRTVTDRFAHLKGPARRGHLPVTQGVVEAELSELQGRVVLALSTEPVAKLANRVLHEAWHPTGEDALRLEIHWKERDGDPFVDFAITDVRDELLTMTENTLSQVRDFINLVIDGGYKNSDSAVENGDHR